MPSLRYCLPGYRHYWLRQGDGAIVCQICGTDWPDLSRPPAGVHD